MRKLLLLLVGCLLLCADLPAQTRVISGKITDVSGTAIPNASVVVKGTATGTTTDASGNFQLSVPSSAKALVISSVGMVEQ
ncbi:MAG TPA: carboxypeptidase-like regulatory domain-containing protein, partial [Chitinophagaceae bacterium]|nr:carboxypeptidase-like regulatory domain-containing protein [Chitinophagaceae bacterium]